MAIERPLLEITRIDTESATLHLRGDLDAGTASLLVAEGELLVLKGYRDLMLDCGALAFCDSFGLRALLTMADRVLPLGSITLVRPSAMLVRLLDLTGLTDSFALVDT